MDQLDANLKRFETKISPAIAAWNERVASGSQVDPGSSLAADDVLSMPQISVSFLVWNSMVQAVDNLHCFADCLERRTIYLTALDSVLRGALFGAVQAVWLLSPSLRTVRQWRTVLAWEDDWRNREQIIDQARKFYPNGEHDEIIGADDERVAANIAESKAWKHATGRPTTELSSYILTKIVAEVATHVFSEDDDNTSKLRNGGLLMTWKYLSSTDHATASSALSRIDQATGRPTADLNMLIASAMAVVLVLSEAWRLYDLRRLAMAQ